MTAMRAPLYSNISFTETTRVIFLLINLQHFILYLYETLYPFYFSKTDLFKNNILGI
jgi:hypothetical protein